jgi:hypothetical protein
MEKGRKITWFIFTNDAHTNKVISTEVPSENMHYDEMCSDGIQRNLWQCSGQFVTKIRQSKKDQQLHFDIYKREGKYGSIKKVNFLKANKRKK